MRLLLVSCLVALMAWSQPGDAGVLHVTTRDAGGQDLLCRVVARDGAGIPVFPDTTSENCYPHHGPIPYFISDGQFDLPATGPVTLTFSKGPEFISRKATVVVTGDLPLSIVLDRLVNLPAAGWHSGDTHVHLWHDEPNPLETADGVRLARAEGLNFVSILDADRYFIGAPDPASTPDCLLYASMEYRSHVYGHIALPGLQSLITPYATAAPGDPPYPLNVDMIAQAKTRGGLVLYAHPMSHHDFWDTSAWPMTGIARELPADAALQLADGLEVLSYSNYEPEAALGLWYDLLNSGAHTAATAGTDAVLNRPQANPVGGYRVYARTGSAGFDMAGWLGALRAGRSFVTAGPLITDVAVGGATIGDTLRLPPGPAVLSGTVSFASDTQLLFFEVIWNGEMALWKALPFASNATASFSIPAGESGWLAVRVRAVSRSDVHVMSTPLAHSGPIWVELGAPVHPRAAAVGRLVDWNDDLRALVRARGGFAEAADSLRVESVLAAARAALGDPFDGPPAAAALVSPASGGIVRQIHPRLQWTAPSDPDPGDALEYRVRLSPSESALAQAPAAATSGTELLITNALEHGWSYYWSVETRDAARNSSFSAVSSFLVDTTGTAGVVEPAPRARWSASPVPFSGSVALVSSVIGPSLVTIYDVAGRRVRVLEGVPPLAWDGRDAQGCDTASGLYFAAPGSAPPIRLVRLR